MTEDTQTNSGAPTQQPQQEAQVQLHGGVYPQPDGKWVVSIWFSGFTSEPAAKHMSGQLEQLIKNAFAPPPPQQG